MSWFEQKGFAEGDFGDAHTLATAKNTAVNGLQTAGIIHSGRGKVRLLRPEELDKEWGPATDDRLTVWEMTHHLLRVFDCEKQGEAPTAALLRKLGSRAEVARDFAYPPFQPGREAPLPGRASSQCARLGMVGRGKAGAGGVRNRADAGGDDLMNAVEEAQFPRRGESVRAS
ncbi:MAG: hypothetical protein ACYDH9_00545 [Limisphaerales bacterium]